MNFTDGMLKEGSLKGKNILITGGGTGLGRSMGEYFLELGANLVITSRKMDVLQQTADEMMVKKGGEVLALACDVRDIAQIESMWSEAVGKFGQIHVVLNNAAGNFISPTERLSVNAFNTVLDIVLKGTSQVTLTAGKHWIANKQPGVFLNIVTTYAWTGSGYVVPSAAAKAGVLALTRSLAVEWAKYGIRSNAIAPGPFPTEGAWSRLLPGDLVKKFDPAKKVPVSERAELDQWIISKLQSLISETEAAMDNYDATKATRAIMNFTVDQLSNWYVRLARKRFWRGDMNADKQAAYETLYECLLTLTQLMSSFAPFYADWMYKNLTEANESGKDSVHLTDWVSAYASLINTDLEASMDLAQSISSLVHSLRKKEKLKVRQPLQRILIPVLSAKTKAQIEHVEELIKTEVNIKAIEYLDDASGILVKNVKPNLPVLGKKLGPKMRFVVAAINSWGQAEIAQIERDGKIRVAVEGETIELLLEEVLISSQDIPGWSVASDQGVTVALDVTLTEELKQEGVARDLVNRIQNLRKDMGLEVQDKIKVVVADTNELVNEAIKNFGEYIQSETQALSLATASALDNSVILDMDDFELSVNVVKA